ncbi:dethiobiotin synthase [Allorhodopirellula solitaria]|uniref:ATP-dependent dethiobiotin synthetase BioD n=1 Tax=Allorhodopirellula solitaria TaxID=2527987 RepID=A0A5C5XSI5_9BACT|nr:dethiobiotin synthase [Allorhodopirellula solitaria]TWT66187.1 ATP-dependent dethiobiotin synthetase BioD 1 [Allorhodopirellula solitaria]
MEVYFVTGTGTDVGKTYCASRYVEMRRRTGLRVGVYKPVASGCIPGDDGDWVAEDAVELWRAAGCPLTLEAVCPQKFAASLAPPQAALAEGREVDEMELLRGVDAWTGPSSNSAAENDARFDVLVVEGAGGLFSPLSASQLNVDFARTLRERLPPLKVVLIAPNRLGVIHDCIAAVRAAQAAGVGIDLIVLNRIASVAESKDHSISTNAQQIEHWTGCPVVEQWS